MSDDRSTLEVQRLSLQIDGRMIVDGIDCTAPAGSVTGVLGPNGSGKSTLLRLLVSAVRPTSGFRVLDGQDLAEMHRRERARQVALVEQESVTDVSLRVLDAVLLGRTPHRSGWSPTTASDVDLARRCLARVGAIDLEERDFSTLSGGERQKVQLARALTQEPRLLLLDEPSNHLDIAAQLALLAHVRDLADGGVTVMVAVHDLNQAMSSCDHVVLLDRGRVVDAGPPEAVLTPERIAEVYGVRAEVVETSGRPILQFAPLGDTHGQAVEGVSRR